MFNFNSLASEMSAKGIQVSVSATSRATAAQALEKVRSSISKSLRASIAYHIVGTPMPASEKKCISASGDTAVISLKFRNHCVTDEDGNKFVTCSLSDLQAVGSTVLKALDSGELDEQLRKLVEKERERSRANYNRKKELQASKAAVAAEAQNMTATDETGAQVGV